MSGQFTRRILDDQNHEDLVGGGYLSLDGGQLRGFLITVNGTRSAPGLMLGSNDTGFWRSSTIVYLNVSGGECMAFTPNMIASWVPLNMGNQLITALADATIATDALNLRTGDARYVRRTDPESPAGAWQDFSPDSGWTSTLRYRLLAGGTSLQLDGTAAGALPVNASAQIGVLPVGYRPVRRQRFAGVVSTSAINSSAFGMVQIDPNGAVTTIWSLAGENSMISVCAVLALD